MLFMSEWKALENIQKLLKPFVQHTSLVGGEKYMTLSSVRVEINLHLEEMKEVSEMASVSWLLQSELKWRFTKYTDPSGPDHEALCLMSTMLDPWYRLSHSRDRNKNLWLLGQAVLAYLDLVGHFLMLAGHNILASYNRYART